MIYKRLESIVVRPGATSHPAITHNKCAYDAAKDAAKDALGKDIHLCPGVRVDAKYWAFYGISYESNLGFTVWVKESESRDE